MIGKKDGQWVFAPEAEERIAELEAQLAALTWTPIRESNLPRVGDEVICDEDGSLQQVCEDSGVSDWTEWGYTHRRPLNPPSPERGANG